MLKMVETIIIVVSEMNCGCCCFDPPVCLTTLAQIIILQIHVQQQLYSIQTSDDTSYDRIINM